MNEKSDKLSKEESERALHLAVDFINGDKQALNSLQEFFPNGWKAAGLSGDW